MRTWVLLFGLLAASGVGAQTDNACGSLANYAFGPYDYRAATPGQKSLVENAHFTAGVEFLQTRKTGTFGHDIGYTLRAFPNHPRALLAMQKLVEKEKRNPAEDAPYTIDCFYERALRFRPDDYVVRLLYVSFLIERGDLKEVPAHLAYVNQTEADNAFAMYNLGLVYFDLKDYGQALAYAHKAFELGLPRTDLKNKLARINKWEEPAPRPAAAAASTPDASASGVP